MKQSKNALIILAMLSMTFVLGLIGVYRAGYIPKGLDIFIIALTVIAAIYAFVIYLKQHKDVKSGFPAEDEMTTLIKYKAGYYAFTASMYMWLLIFLSKRLFPDVETMLGSGILMSAVFAIVIKIYLTRNYHADQD